MKGIIQHVLGAPSCLSLYPLSDFRPQNQGGNILSKNWWLCFQYPQADKHWPGLVTISVPPWGRDTRHHITCYCLNVRGLFDPIIISSQSHSVRTSPGWSGDNAHIVIICIKRRKDQHENRKRPWDKVLRVSSDGLWSLRISHPITSSLNIFSHCQKKCQEKSHLGECCLSAVLNYTHWPPGPTSWMMGFGRDE